MQLPAVSGSNLHRQKIRLPEDLEGALNLVLIAFQQWQQRQVDTWLPLARRLEEAYPALRYYELPTIQRLNPLARTFINEGMRAGIPDTVARERTITLYLDKRAFREALHLPSEENIYALLLDAQGQVLWRADGVLTADKAESLAQAVEQALAPGEEKSPARTEGGNQ
jgi:hypothetical protein